MKRVVLLKSQVAQHGGLEKYASRIANSFLDHGMEVSILTTGLKNNLSIHPNISIYSTQTCRWPAFWRMEEFDHFVQKHLKVHPADIVFGMDRNRSQTHFRAGNGVHAAFLKSRSYLESKLKVFSFRFNPLHRKILEIEKTAFENPDLQKLFTNSEMVRNQILEHYRVDANKIEVIHNGVEWHEMENDFNEWKNVKEKAALKKNLNPADFHFLFIGNGYLRKGLIPLLSAFAELRKKNVHLSIIGKDSDIDHYQKMAEQLGITDQVSFFGPQKEIRPFYQIADAFVIPSFYDPFANVTVEALAMGLFVVSSKFNGGHEILSEENGIIIDNLFDPDSFKNSLSIALNHPKTESLSQQIRQSVKHLDFSKQLNRLILSCLKRGEE